MLQEDDSILRMKYFGVLFDYILRYIRMKGLHGLFNHCPLNPHHLELLADYPLGKMSMNGERVIYEANLAARNPEP